MSKVVVRVSRHEDPLLEILSHGRSGPQRRDRFTPGQIAQIARMVRRAPEVMVKVSGGGRSTGAVAAHFSHISGQGRIDIEMDEGNRQGGTERAPNGLASRAHLVVKAEGRDGLRLHIDKATLREWRALCRTDASARCARQCHCACRARPNQEPAQRGELPGDAPRTL